MGYSDIKLFAHCKTCKSGTLAIGQTNDGVEVWCERCAKSVVFMEDVKMFDIDRDCECDECKVVRKK